jgi:hypothetical protein
MCQGDFGTVRQIGELRRLSAFPKKNKQTTPLSMPVAA